MTAGRTIMDLDDYSLRHVFSFLPRLSEKATVGYTCLRFRSIIGPFIGSQEINDMLRFQFGDPKQFFANYGIYIKKIDLHYSSYENEFYYLIPKYCHNIESAGFRFFENDYEFAKNLLASNKSIKHLELTDSPIMADIVYEHICRLRSLETLILKSCHGFTGEHLYRLTNLKELSLEGCEELNSNHFIGICKANKLLKLNIVGCSKLNTEAFRTLVKTQTELEEIHVDGWYNSGEMSRIAFLENLRRISIRYKYGFEDNSESLLEKFPETRTSLLKYLKIDCLAPDGLSSKELQRIVEFENLEELVIVAVKNFSDAVLTQISKSCKWLRRIEVAHCLQISKEGILQLIRSLKLLTQLNLGLCENLRGDLYQDMCEARRTSDVKEKLKVHANGDFLDNEEQYAMNKNLVQLFYNSEPFDVSKWESMREAELDWQDHGGDYEHDPFSSLEFY